MLRHLGTLAVVVPLLPTMASSSFTGTPAVYYCLGVSMGFVFSAS